ncbi:MAG: FHA domain-containing protein [Gammaproteobacteria bacterium]|nr:FHA domain-containing protein [Gammaproteobacteria bacterium]
MASEKNNINELVADDDDQTAELEAVTFRQEHPIRGEVPPESDEHTSDFAEHRSTDARTIGKLQYDIEQLRAKWLGLEAEITAREELTSKLNADIDGLRKSVSRKEKLLKTRDRKIKALKAEIRSRDERHRLVTAELRNEIESTRQAVREIPELKLSAHTQDTLANDENRLARSEAYADALRRRLQDVLSLQETLQSERGRLAGALAETVDKNRHLEEALATAADDKMQLNQQLEAIGEKHAEEIRMLRFELGEAQETVAQSEILNSQLASDLVDTRGFKEELERMLCDSDEQSNARISELENELAKMTRIANDFEQKLDARSEAINVLLTELARKSEQMESINEIGEVISDIDGRISEQFDDVDDELPPTQKSADRVTRVLVGKIGKQLLRFPLFKDRLTIGRTEDNDIQLNAAYISRRHAVVQADNDATRVIDWGSKNGVFVNSNRVTEHFLKNGDIVTIGNAHFRYEERPKRDA